MWKKGMIFSSLFAFCWLMIAFPLAAETTHAKSFRSGIRSFKQNPNGIHGGQKNLFNGSNPIKNGIKNSRFTKGLLLGGLAGLFFGSHLQASILGQTMGLFINLLTIFLIFLICKSILRIYRIRKQGREKE